MGTCWWWLLVVMVVVVGDGIRAYSLVPYYYPASRRSPTGAYQTRL